MVDEMKAANLTVDEAQGYANAAHLLRHPRAYDLDESTGEIELNAHRAPIQPIDLLRPRRMADKGLTAWKVFNVTQENAVRGGQRGWIIGKNGKVRNQKTRAVNGIAESEKLNRALWDMAVMATKSKRAA